MRGLCDSIRDDDPSMQRFLRAVAATHTLTELLLAVWPLACTLALHLVESVLAERAQRLTPWPPYPACGAPLRRQYAPFRKKAKRATVMRTDPRLADAGTWVPASEEPEVELSVVLPCLNEAETLNLLYAPLLTSVASRNLLLYQSPLISIPCRHANVRRRKDDTCVGTTARSITE
jgi:hypothetical protein